MSRDSYCFDGQTAASFAERGVRPFAAPAPLERSPVCSNASAGFESSAFGSGSSVLSAFEPPNDAELMEKTSLLQAFDESVLFTSSLEELEALISKLQTIYFYRQGLKALTDERMAQKRGRTMEMGGLHGSTSSSFCGIPNVATPRAIPGSSDPIWRMDHDQLSTATRAVEVAAMDMSGMGPPAPAPAPPFQTTLQQEAPTRNAPMALRATNGEIQRGGEYKRKSRRQNSCPVALCAPQWADATWNPRMTIRTHAQTSSHGTGVFLPPTVSETSTPLQNGCNDCERSLPDETEP